MLKTVSYMPTPAQDLLLKAALFDGDDALKAWRAWRSRVALDDADFASQRLLPLLLDNLERLSVDDPDLARYRSVARHVWLENQLHLNHAMRVLKILRRAEIPTMALKGLAVAQLYYSHPKLRGMGDIDIMVPFGSARDAARLLADHGWTCEYEVEKLSRDVLTLCHSAAFTNAQGASIDLHWHALLECCWPEADDTFWQQAEPLVLAGVETRTLSHTDQLFHALMHGSRPCEMAPIRWVADSAFILRRAPIDWQRLFALAEAFKLVRRLQRTLGYLHEAMALPVPDSAMRRLSSMKPGRLEQLEERATYSRAPEVLKSTARRYVHYRRNVAERDSDEGFLRHLQTAFGTHSFSETVLWVVRRILSGRASGHPNALDA